MEAASELEQDVDRKAACEALEMPRDSTETPSVPERSMDQ